MSVEIAYRFGFDAAHHFEHFPAGHPNRRMHGHSFQVEVAITGVPSAQTGFVADFGEVAQACDELRRQLDHGVLNEIAGLAQPSLENLSIWIWRALVQRFPHLVRVTVSRDSCGQSSTYRGA